jgi:hypothetical protein
LQLYNDPARLFFKYSTYFHWKASNLAVVQLSTLKKSIINMP